jgi:hypothetical protein
MFPQDSGLDLKKQQEVLNKLVQYKALLPVLSEHHDSASDDTNKGLDYFRHSDDYSVCDVIMYDVPRQTMEVVEHLLHNISDIGLHYAYPDEWAFNDKNSEVYKTMDQAIQEGLYDISSYEDILEEAGDEIYQRVIVQEYAYWLISTYWNLQEPYGPMEEEEWNIDNKKELLE